MRDGHVHSHYCPHGSNDQFEEYIEQALRVGVKEISFTEHAPLPVHFEDTAPTKDSAMNQSDLFQYIEEVRRMKEKYENQIIIHCGLEVDYIEGFEEETTKILNEVGPYLTDSILSVHFLKGPDRYDCLDYSPDYFASMIERYGTIEAVYQKYYDTVKKSITTPLGIYKPRRIGHMTLAHKFQKKYPCPARFSEEIADILLLVKANGYELDYNGAGVAKPLCREPYPPEWIIKQAKELDIPLVYGSDAHQAKELLQGYEQCALLI